MLQGIREDEKLIKDIVKSSMKNRSGTYGKTRKTLPLEAGLCTYRTQGVAIIGFYNVM